MAQPTIDLANNQPISGQEFVLQTSNTWSTAGPTGANVMFGFWDLSATGNRNYRVFDASITSTAATSIPTANMLSTDGGTDTLFWNYAADGLYQVGSRSGLEGLVSYSDPILELKYPCTNGTTWSDITIANYTSPLGPATRTGTITGEADSYGDLGLPEAFTSNVLRVHVRRALTDVAALATVQRVSNTWYFFAETSPWPLLKLVEDSVVVNGGAPTVTRSAQWVGGPGGVGISELNASDIQFTPYPNPTTGVLNISAELSDLRSVEVFSAAGQLVRSSNVRRIANASGFMDLTGLPSGVYQLRITQNDGRTGSRRIVLQ